MNENNKEFNYLKVIAILMAILGIINPFIIWIIFHYANDDTIRSFQGLGPIGDWIGGTTASYINLAALIILLATYFTQREELKATNANLKITSEEITHQKFENKFYHLISLYNEIVSNMKAIEGDVEYVGRECFKHVYESLTFKNNKEQRDLVDVYIEIDEVYPPVYKEYQHILNNYFNTLYLTLEFLSGQKQSERNYYVKLLKAQLSSYEIIILMYHSITENGSHLYKFAREYKIVDFDEINNLNEFHFEHYWVYKSYEKVFNEFQLSVIYNPNQAGE